MNLKNGNLFTSKFFGTGPSSCKKRIYRAALSQGLRKAAVCFRLKGLLGLNKHCLQQ